MAQTWREIGEEIAKMTDEQKDSFVYVLQPYCQEQSVYDTACLVISPSETQQLAQEPEEEPLAYFLINDDEEKYRIGDPD